MTDIGRTGCPSPSHCSRKFRRLVRKRLRAYRDYDPALETVALKGSVPQCYHSRQHCSCAIWWPSLLGIMEYSACSCVYWFGHVGTRGYCSPPYNIEEINMKTILSKARWYSRIDGAMLADREAYSLSPLVLSLIPSRCCFHTQYHSAHDSIPLSDAGHCYSKGCHPKLIRFAVTTSRRLACQRKWRESQDLVAFRTACKSNVICRDFSASSY